MKAGATAMAKTKREIKAAKAERAGKSRQEWLERVCPWRFAQFNLDEYRANIIARIDSLIVGGDAIKLSFKEIIRTGEDTYLVDDRRDGISEMTRAELERKVVPIAAERASERSHRLIYA